MIARDDLGALLQRTQRIAAKLHDLAHETTGRPSLFLVAQIDDLEQDLGRLIEDEMDRRVRVRQFADRGLTPTDGIPVTRISLGQSPPPPLSQKCGWQRKAADARRAARERSCA